MGASAQRGTTNDARRAKIHPMDVLPREPRLMRITTSLRKPFDVVLALAATFAALGGMAAWHHGAGEHAHDAPAIALLIASRRAYFDQLRARARDLERERELLADRAVADERVRITRELHDAVAHHVSLLVVQAGAIRESLPPDAPQPGVADSMAAPRRQALSEMRNMLGLLRTGNGASAEPEHEPQPGLAQLRALVGQTATAGVDVDLRV